MGDYINREAAISKLRLVEIREAGINFPAAMLFELKSIPPADVVEVRHGRWIDRPSKRGYGMSTYCSCCGRHSGIGGIESNRHRAYCPNCGAKMDGGQDE